MKKFSLILLICIYSLSTVGFSFKEFYCCGKLKSIELTFAQASNSKCSKGEEKTGCCNNKYHLNKIKDNHFVSDDISVPVKYFTRLKLFIFSFSPAAFEMQQINIANRSNAPPLYNGVPVHISNCVFRV